MRPTSRTVRQVSVCLSVGTGQLQQWSGARALYAQFKRKMGEAAIMFPVPQMQRCTGANRSRCLSMAPRTSADAINAARRESVPRCRGIALARPSVTEMRVSKPWISQSE